nr:hypothetical protein [Tanacetum cinerariifolium]
MDVTKHTIRPQIISFLDDSLKDGSKTAANQRSSFSSQTTGDSRTRLVANSEESLANPDDVDQFGDSSIWQNTVAPKKGTDTGGGNVITHLFARRQFIPEDTPSERECAKGGQAISITYACICF